jgi:hypothetical protein
LGARKHGILTRALEGPRRFRLGIVTRPCGGLSSEHGEAEVGIRAFLGSEGPATARVVLLWGELEYGERDGVHRRGSEFGALTNLGRLEGSE